MGILQVRAAPQSVWVRERSSNWWSRIVLETFGPHYWIENFRMRKETFVYLCNAIRHVIVRRNMHFACAKTVRNAHIHTSLGNGSQPFWNACLNHSKRKRHQSRISSPPSSCLLHNLMDILYIIIYMCICMHTYCMYMKTLRPINKGCVQVC